MELKRQVVSKGITIEYKTLEDVLNLVKELGLSPSEVKFEVKEYDWSEGTYPVLVYNTLESEEDFKLRQDLYKTALHEQEKRDRVEYEKLKKRFEPS